MQRKYKFLWLIPIMLLILEIIMMFTGMQYDHGSWIMSGGWNPIGMLAIVGTFVLPFICLIPEIIGFVTAVKKNAVLFRIIYISELLLTVPACFLSVFLFIQSLHHK